MLYEVNEYVWDRPRRAPGVVIGVGVGADRPYTVAEIVLPRKHLGRVAHRREDELERYVNLAVPEQVVQRMYALWGENEQFDEVGIEGRSILKAAMESRGIEPAWSP